MGPLISHDYLNLKCTSTCAAEYGRSKHMGIAWKEMPTNNWIETLWVDTPAMETEVSTTLIWKSDILYHPEPVSDSSTLAYYFPKVLQLPTGAMLGFFSSPPRPDRLWGPPSLLSSGYQGLFLRVVKRPGREADHSPPSSAEFKNAWIYTFTPPIRLHGVVLN
jgi:hypothetical protein